MGIARERSYLMLLMLKVGVKGRAISEYAYLTPFRTSRMRLLHTFSSIFTLTSKVDSVYLESTEMVGIVVR